MQVNIGTAQIENTQNEKLLGNLIDSKLSFDKYIQQICSRAYAELKALARIAPFMNITKRKILMNAPSMPNSVTVREPGCFIVEN